MGQPLAPWVIMSLNSNCQCHDKGNWPSVCCFQRPHHQQDCPLAKATAADSAMQEPRQNLHWDAHSFKLGNRDPVPWIVVIGTLSDQLSLCSHEQ